MHYPPPFPSAASPLYAPSPAHTTSPVVVSTGPPNLAVSPTSPMDPPSSDDRDGHVLVLSDGTDGVYTTTVYSTRDLPSTLNSTPADIKHFTQSGPNFAAIVAGVGGGVALLLLLVGVIWYTLNRKAKRRTDGALMRDRKFYPDRYNQTVTSCRHGEFDKIEPGPVVVQPPPILRRHPTVLSPGALSRQASSYHNHTTPPCVHVNWAGAPSTEETLEDVPSSARHRIPYPCSPVQPVIDRFTVLPSRSASDLNSPNSLRFALPPPPHPHNFRSPTFTHRRYHSHQSYHNRPHCQGHDQGSYYTPTHSPLSSPMPTRVTRRYTVVVSPPRTPSLLPTLPSPPWEYTGTRSELSTVTPKNTPSAARSMSPTDSFVETPTTNRMMCTNPDSDVDLETDTEPEGSRSISSSDAGSPSPTDIIQLYGRDFDPGKDTSPTNSILKDNGKDLTTVSISPVPG